MTWWRRLLQRGRLERQMDAELRDHIERQVADYRRAGLAEADARRRAAIEFGGLDQIREQCRDARGTRFVEDCVQDTRYACRTLAKRPGFVLAALLLLGLGIGVNTAIFSLVHAVIFRDVNVAAPGELYFLAHRHGDRTHATSNYPLLERVRDRRDVFVDVAAYALETFKIANGDDLERVTGEYVTGNYHGVLGVPFAVGRGFTAEGDRPSANGFIAVISDSYWTRVYNRAPDILGKSLTIDGRALSVVGVTAPGFQGFTPGRPADVTLPLSIKVAGAPGYLTMHDTWTSLVMVGRLKPQVSRSQANAVLDVVFRQYVEEPENKWYRLDSTALLPARHGSNGLRDRYSPSLSMLMAMVLVVLLIALANFALLQQARASSRSKEMSIRLAIGAGRGRLVRQLVTESMMLSIAGGVVGLLLAAWGTATIAALFRGGENPIVLDVQANSAVFAFTAGLSLVAGLVFGLMPALLTTRVDLVPALKDALPSSAVRRSRWSNRQFLAAGQVGLCLLLVIGAGLLFRTLENLQAPDGTFDGRGVVLVSAEAPAADVADDYWPRACAELLDRVGQQPGTAASACSTSVPVDMTESRRGAFAGTAPVKEGVLANVISPEFFRTYDIPLVRGRTFTAQDSPAAMRVGVINERLSRLAFGDGDPIGRTFHFRAEPKAPYTIVGVVRDVRHNPREAAPPTVYTPLGQGGEIEEWMTVGARSTPDGSLSVETLRAAIKTARPDLVTIRPRTFGEQVGGFLTRERALALLAGWFGVLALVLACVGLYGVMSQDVTRRRQEIGIRLALGADASQVVRAVVCDAAAVALVGILVGTVAALGLSRLIAGLLFDVSARDPLTFVSAAVLLAVTSLLAGYLPARRAARVDPTTVLRTQ